MALKKISNNGTPSVVTAGLTGERLTAALKIVAVTPPTSSFGNVVSDLMEGLNEEAVVVVDTKNRKVYASTAPNKGNLSAAFMNANAVLDQGNKVTLAPVVGQTGTSLEFNKVEGPTASDAIKDVTDLITEPVKPKRSLGSILSTLLSQAYQENKEPVIVIDQSAKTITVVEADNLTADSPVQLAAYKQNDECIEVSLTGDAETVNPSVTRLAFEGGAV